MSSSSNDLPRRTQTAEEVYAQCLVNTQVLDAAARRQALDGDAVGALTLAWGADVYAVQGVLWERIIGAAAATHRQLYRAADALFRGLRGAAPEATLLEESCADALQQARNRLLEECDEGLAAAIRAAWTEHSFLADLKPPTAGDLQAAARTRCRGRSVLAHAGSLRVDAVAAMQRAQALRVRGDTTGALQECYEADLLGLEAYLLESALAAGDSDLLTVTIRWELAIAAIAGVDALPADFTRAVTRMRKAMCAGLAESDGVRCLMSLTSVESAPVG